jgi:dimethylamine corrinoid protein
MGFVLEKFQRYPKPEVVTVKEIRQAVIAGENEEAVAIANKLINRGVKPEEIIVQGVTKAMAYLDRKCTIRDFCLLELMLAGRAAMDVIDCLYAEGTATDDLFFDKDLYPGKKIILGTIKGDIHEIGRNIFSMVMRTHGYQILDMGKDVDPADLVTAAIDHQADFIGISSLTTTTIQQVQDVRRIAVDQGLGAVKIIAGGAALQQSSAEYLNVDYVADTAFDGLHYISAASGRERQV